MPIYEYRCEACGERFEKLVRSARSDEPVVCPRCSAVETRKQFSAFSALGLERAASGGSYCAPGRGSG